MAAKGAKSKGIKKAKPKGANKKSRPAAKNVSKKAAAAKGKSTKKLVSSKSRARTRRSSSKRLVVGIISSECFPYAKVGGLADVIGALGKFLPRQGVEPVIVLPGYRCIKRGFAVEDTGYKISTPIGYEWHEANILKVKEAPKGSAIYLIDQPHFFDREGIYTENNRDYPDNHQRFIYLAKAALELFKRIDKVPAIIQCNDWQAGWVPLFLKAFYGQDPFYKGTKTVMAIHNLAYQGIFPANDYFFTGLDWQYFNHNGVEFYGNINILKAGIVYADKILTVSKTYAKEIQAEQYGMGLEGVLRARGKDIVGITNGIDTDVWDPWTDPHLPYKFGRRGTKFYIKGKNACKAMLQKELELEIGSTCLLSVIARFTHQKGIDVILETADRLLNEGTRAQFVLLGNGDGHLEALADELQKKHSQYVRFVCGFNDPLAHRIYAASDIFMMPSRFEPCGISQMIAMRYGALPIGYATGGLKETIDPKIGFLFTEYGPEPFKEVLNKAIYLYYNNTEEWKSRMLAAMAIDNSWDKKAADYVGFYKKVLYKRSVRDG